MDCLDAAAFSHEALGSETGCFLANQHITAYF